MASPYITKSDFKACCDCRTKLFYRKNAYPTNSEDNEYLRLLADGGFMIEIIAKAKFQHGVDLVETRDPVAAFEQTKSLLANGDGTIFEAAATIGKYHIRADILRREGTVLHLIEVKSSSIGEDDDVDSPFLTAKGTVAARWLEYVMDVAFQTHVLGLAFPGYRIVPYLCVVDKRNPVNTNETLDKFSLKKDEANPKARPVVMYHGNPAELAKSQLVCVRPVEHEVNLVMAEVTQKAAGLAALLNDKTFKRVQEDIGDFYKICRKCDFRVKGSEKNGFVECWGALAKASPHVLDLHRVGQIGSTKTADPIPGLIKRGRASYLDLEITDLGTPGSYQQRRLMQWESMKAGGIETMPTPLKNELEKHRQIPGWPLHFIDFEACDISLPHHAGLRPYERVAFQWSCHTIHKDGHLSHAEWINTKRKFPNFAFAVSLRERIGDTGTVYVWSPYEQTTLRRVLRQISEWLKRAPMEAVQVAGIENEAALVTLGDWIEMLLGPEDKKGKRISSRIVDLHDLARTHYFHPLMGGRTSIKVVLPSVWAADAKVRNHPWFSAYLKLNEDRQPLDPYSTLPPLPLGDEDDEDDVVREGTGAIRVYQDMLFVENASAHETENRRKLLLQYCRLDTAAMVMIWMHWTKNTELNSATLE